MKIFGHGPFAVLPSVLLIVCGFALGVTSLAQRAKPPAARSKPPDYKSLSLTPLKTLAENGDAEAQNELGMAYASAKKGVKKPDLKEAFKWVRMAAESGLDRAQYHLGGFYFYGSGVPKDYEEAMKWYRKAAEQGFIQAQYFLGWLHSTGVGSDEKYKDFKESVQWFKKAADQGDPEAQLSLGLMYLRGEDLNPDYVEAYKWINLSAAQGHTNAIRHRVKLSVSMTSDQIAEGQRRAVQFSEKPPGAAGATNKPAAPPPQSAGK